MLIGAEQGSCDVLRWRVKCFDVMVAPLQRARPRATIHKDSRSLALAVMQF